MDLRIATEWYRLHHEDSVFLDRRTAFRISSILMLLLTTALFVLVFALTEIVFSWVDFSRPTGIAIFISLFVLAFSLRNAVTRLLVDVWYWPFRKEIEQFAAERDSLKL